MRYSLRRLFTVLLLSLVVCLLRLPSAAQEPAAAAGNTAAFGSSLKKSGIRKLPPVVPRSQLTSSTDDVIRVETRLVISDVLVLDKTGRSVGNLVRDDFRVLEDGDIQDITTFAHGNESGAIPRSVVLIIDYSGSQLPYINSSVAAAKLLVDKLNANDRMAIVTDDVELLVNFTSDRKLLKEKLDLLTKKALSGETGQSRQYSALMAALREMFRDGEPRPIVIFQTDGDELPRLGSQSAYRKPEDQDLDDFKYADLIAAAEKAGASINVVMPGLRFEGLSADERLDRARQDLENSKQAYVGINQPRPGFTGQPFSKRFVKSWAEARSRDEAALTVLAKSTGGWSANLERPEDAAEAYSRIFSSIDLRYMIGYYPTNQKRDGRRREVTIKVRNCEDCVVWGRKTYLAPTGEQ